MVVVDYDTGYTEATTAIVYRDINSTATYGGEDEHTGFIVWYDSSTSYDQAVKADDADPKARHSFAEVWAMVKRWWSPAPPILEWEKWIRPPVRAPTAKYADPNVSAQFCYY